MDGQLKKGATLRSESGTAYQVISLLGSGGQGEVYQVESAGKPFALKWYFPHTSTRTQKQTLENLILKGPPDTSFLWPQDMIFRGEGQPFGYIMPLRPERFKSIVDLMKRRAEPSFCALCRAAYNLTAGYEKLHAMGYSYRDISFGNLFFDPDTGEVLICDNDNAAANGTEDGAVYGTPRFMAPEIVTGQAKPSRNTDLYSLAVLLFYMLMLGHPLEGKLEADIRCMDIPAMNRLYGTDPVFVFDPGDSRNRPVPGYQDNVLIYWKLYPQVLRELFTRSFTEGLRTPGCRVTEKQWLAAFANLITGIVPCPACGAEVFYDEEKAAAAPHTCWNCQSAVPMPPALSVGKSRILLHREAKLYAHHLRGDYDMDTVAGTVVQNPKNPALWGIRNDTGESWTYLRADGTSTPIPPGRSGAMAKGAKIDFGRETGEFQ